MGDYITYKEPITVKGLPGAIQFNDGAGDLDYCPSAKIEQNLDGTCNLYASYFVGDGQYLSNIKAKVVVSSNLQQVSEVGNVTNQTVFLTNTETSLINSGNVIINSPTSQLLFDSNVLIKTIKNTTGRIAIGSQAGEQGQNNFSVAIGYQAGQSGQHSNTIVINSLPTALNTENENALYIKPIRSNILVSGNLLSHTNTGEVLDTTINVYVDGNYEKGMELIYDDVKGAFVNEYNNFTAIKVIADEDILKGHAVYISSGSGDTPGVKQANAGIPDKMPSIGLAMENIRLNNSGHVVTFGVFNNSISSGLVGDILYVSTTNGVLTNVVPENTVTPDLIQNVGICIKDNGNRKIFVTGVGRANDIPNANVLADDSTVDYVYVNTDGHDLKKIDPSLLACKPQTLQEVSDTGNVTSNTIQFTNPTTSFVTTSNVGIGTNNPDELLTLRDASATGDWRFYSYGNDFVIADPKGSISRNVIFRDSGAGTGSRPITLQVEGRVKLNNDGEIYTLNNKNVILTAGVPTTVLDFTNTATQGLYLCSVIRDGASTAEHCVAIVTVDSDGSGGGTGLSVKATLSSFQMTASTPTSSQFFQITSPSGRTVNATAMPLVTGQTP